MKKIINIKMLEGINGLLLNLNVMERWGSINAKDDFNQLVKQATNATVLFFLGKQYEYETKTKLNWEIFPRIMTFYACKNVYATADVTEAVINRTLKTATLPPSAMTDYAIEKIAEKISPEFAEWCCEGIGTDEETLYKAASKIATLVELRQISSTDRRFKRDKLKSIERDLSKYKSIPGMKEMTSERMLNAMQFIAKMRYQNRWATFPKNVKCSVLGHEFDTAVYSYIISIEKGFCESNATKAFFLGLFHDLGELLTKDMPSSTKDGIDGYRDASEIVEEELMEEELYPRFPKHLADELRQQNFELPINSKFTKIVKGADYLSAASEIDRQVNSGSRYSGYLMALLKHEDKFRKGKAILGPETRKLFKRICRTSYRFLITNSNSKVKATKMLLKVMFG